MENDNRFGLGVFVCVFNKDYSKIMLLFRNAEKRVRWGADWGNVGGVVEFGETTAQASIREVREEIGINLKTSDLSLVFVKETLDFLPHLQAVHFVYATTIDENKTIKLNRESDRYNWFKLSNLPEKMLDSKKDIIKWRNLARSDRRSLN
jgi:8-oxo-dGTP pyrophosphatase MutT (NUDIX family)